MSDTVKTLLKGKSTKEYIAARSKHIPSIWVQASTKVKGKPMRFVDLKDPHRHRPYQRDVLDDKHPHIATKKSRQAGQTEVETRREMWYMRYGDRLTWVHVFPRQRQITDYVNSRVKIAISDSPIMTKLLEGGQDNVHHKQFGNNNWFFRSGWDSGLGEGVDADGVTFDEKDRMKGGVEVAFEESLSSSKLGRIVELSTPTIPGYGIAVPFERSDQKNWHIKCLHCGGWQAIGPEHLKQVQNYADDKPDLTEHDIPEGAYAYLCSKCGGDLEESRWGGFHDGNGEWVAKYPSRDAIRGYAINQMMCVWISATTAYRKRLRYGFLQLWYNYVAGLEYAGEGQLLTGAHIDRLIQPVAHRHMDLSDIVHTSVGIDWGHVNWIIIIGRRRDGLKRILDVHWIRDDPHNPDTMIKQLCTYLVPFQPAVIVADAGFGKDRIPKLRNKFPGKVWGCLYPGTPHTGIDRIDAEYNENQMMIRADKTTSLQLAMGDLREAKYIIHSQFPAQKLELFKKHCLNLALVRDMDDVTGDISQWVVRTGDDHLANAFNYAKLGIESLGRLGNDSGGFLGFAG